MDLDAICCHSKDSRYSWSLDSVSRVLTLCTVKSSYITNYSRPLYQQFWLWTNLRLCSAIVLSVKKNPYISRFAQFKPMLFKSQMCLYFGFILFQKQKNFFCFKTQNSNIFLFQKNRNLKVHRQMYPYGWFMLMYGRNQHNIVSYPSIKKK